MMLAQPLQKPLLAAVRVKGRKATQKGVVYVSQFVPPHRLSVIENYTKELE